jgi:hypothetical protein
MSSVRSTDPLSTAVTRAVSGNCAKRSSNRSRVGPSRCSSFHAGTTTSSPTGAKVAELSSETESDCAPTHLGNERVDALVEASVKRGFTVLSVRGLDGPSGAPDDSCQDARVACFDDKPGKLRLFGTVRPSRRSNTGSPLFRGPRAHVRRGATNRLEGCSSSSRIWSPSTQI